jgi:hypothetical protein
MGFQLLVTGLGHEQTDGRVEGKTASGCGVSLCCPLDWRGISVILSRAGDLRVAGMGI